MILSWFCVSDVLFRTLQWGNDDGQFKLSVNHQSGSMAWVGSGLHNSHPEVLLWPTNRGQERWAFLSTNLANGIKCQMGCTQHPQLMWSPPVIKSPQLSRAPSYQKPPVIKSPQSSNIKCPQISGAIADSSFFFRNCPVLFRSVLQSLIWIAQRNSKTGSQAGQQTCALIWRHGCDGSW